MALYIPKKAHTALHYIKLFIMKKSFLLLLLGGSLSACTQSKIQYPMIKEIQPSATTGSSQAVVVDSVPLAHTAQFLPLTKEGTLVGDKDLSKQIDQVFNNISLALKEADSDLDRVVKINVYLSEGNLIPEVQKAFSLKFTGNKPAVSFVTGDLSHPDAAIAMDAIAVSGLHTDDRVRYFNSPELYTLSKAAHVSVLPAGGVTYVSGQADKGDITEATRGTIWQLDSTLKFLGITKNQVIQIKSFMQPMTDVHVVEEEFARFFEGSTVPPLVFVDWVSQDPVIEIELIAASPAETAKAADQMSFLTPPFMTGSPIYSKVAQINRGKKFYISSLYGASDDPEQQTTELFASLKELLPAIGSDFAHLGKATYYVSDEVASAALNKIRPDFYDPQRPPAASKAMVKGVGKGMSINIDMIGVVKE